eukprot:m.161112 g.161112  ORF g.161112 m.161112 type:complete len:94 (+) comp38800_c0_seq6:220-501(+)
MQLFIDKLFASHSSCKSALISKTNQKSFQSGHCSVHLFDICLQEFPFNKSFLEIAHFPLYTTVKSVYCNCSRPEVQTKFGCKREAVVFVKVQM